jgi:hypothetical protein
MDHYEHKHQDLSATDPGKGLSKMATDIAKSLFRTLASEGGVFTAEHFRSLEVRYVRMAQDTITRHYADALLNGLKFDRHSEEVAVSTFARSLRLAAEEFLRDPNAASMSPRKPVRTIVSRTGHLGRTTAGLAAQPTRVMVTVAANPSGFHHNQETVVSAAAARLHASPPTNPVRTARPPEALPP